MFREHHPGWKMVKGKKRIQSEEHPSRLSESRLVRHQVDGCPIVLKECFIPLNPVKFSSSMLAAMDAVVRAHLPSLDCPAIPQDATKPNVEQRLKLTCKRRLAMCQVKATPSVVEVSPRLTPAAVWLQRRRCMSSEPSSTTAVEEVVEEEEVSRSGPPIQRPSRFIKKQASTGSDHLLIPRSWTKITPCQRRRLPRPSFPVT
ncbi:uncharacterized protein LOC127352013 [Dicentrarchus labrax]|uniref:uncharacterized protein LOC127352013 n=1 Tax=Dicentrarchus labrax TaxID=13489 RepID=UPI0021F5C8A4|nr:uncharacterized protein LOC127352013 [Dicentrarchus labrax]